MGIVSAEGIHKWDSVACKLRMGIYVPSRFAGKLRMLESKTSFAHGDDSSAKL